MINKEFVYRKIRLIQQDLVHLEVMSGLTFDELDQDDIKYHATERYLERIITRAIDINRHLIAECGKGTEEIKTYHDTFLRLADIDVYPIEFSKTIAPSAGLRNILVHDYDSIDAKLIYHSIHDALSQYAQYCSHILSFLESQK